MDGVRAVPLTGFVRGGTGSTRGNVSRVVGPDEHRVWVQNSNRATKSGSSGHDPLADSGSSSASRGAAARLDWRSRPFYVVHLIGPRNPSGGRTSDPDLEGRRP